MTDFAVARKTMVDTQISPSDVTDRRILAAMLEVPREQFLPVSLRQTAYMDGDITLVPKVGDKPPRYLMAPRVFAKLLQAADIKSGDLVLDIGCGTGYSAAILAQLADSVVGLEAEAELVEQAGRKLVSLKIGNAAIVTGPLNEGYPSEGPYDVIVIEGSVPDVPRKILEQLKEGGRLVTVIADNGFGEAVLFQNVNGGFSRRPLFSAAAKPLPGFEKEPGFVF